MGGKLKIGVLVSGGGSNLQAIIDACRDGRINGEVVFVGADNARAGGIHRAERHGIPTFVVDYTGIIGHAANRSIDDPAVAVVYHQAESFDVLRSFLASDELRMAMREAGVVSDPEITFHTGGWAKRYA